MAKENCLRDLRGQWLVSAPGRLGFGGREVKDHGCLVLGLQKVAFLAEASVGMTSF